MCESRVLLTKEDIKALARHLSFVAFPYGEVSYKAEFETPEQLYCAEQLICRWRNERWQARLEVNRPHP